MNPEKSPGTFTRFAHWVADASGRPAVFAVAAAVVVLWALTGPFVNYSDTWQLTINTGTTIITFLMVFLIQNTQNRDAKAMQIKLNELIRATEGAHNALVSVEQLDDEELKRFIDKYATFAEEARRRSLKGRDDTAVLSLENKAQVSK
jgi:low affinity Fe/Cu permease